MYFAGRLTPATPRSAKYIRSHKHSHVTAQSITEIRERAQDVDDRASRFRGNPGLSTSALGSHPPRTQRRTAHTRHPTFGEIHSQSQAYACHSAIHHRHSRAS